MNKNDFEMRMEAKQETKQDRKKSAAPKCPYCDNGHLRYDARADGLLIIKTSLLSSGADRFPVIHKVCDQDDCNHVAMFQA